MEEYITYQEAAQILKRNVRTVTRYVANGTLQKYIRLNNVFVKRSDVERLATHHPSVPHHQRCNSQAC